MTRLAGCWLDTPDRIGRGSFGGVEVFLVGTVRVGVQDTVSCRHLGNTVLFLSTPHITAMFPGIPAGEGVGLQSLGGASCILLAALVLTAARTGSQCFRSVMALLFRDGQGRGECRAVAASAADCRPHYTRPFARPISALGRGVRGSCISRVIRRRGSSDATRLG